LLSQLSQHYGSGAETALNRDFRTLGPAGGSVLEGLF
jgi:hypothetical protein